MLDSISLVSSFSIDCVIDKGRVSLAHLIEFSHFIDIYVLEDRFYVPTSALNTELKPFLIDPDCPLLPLSDNTTLGNTVSLIDFGTRDIYDAAPTNYTFSTGSYVYWLDESERKNVPKSRPAWAEGVSHSMLLYDSHSLNSEIENAIELIATTKATLIPSTRNLLPFLSVFHEYDSPARRLYNELAHAHHVTVKQVMSLLRPRSVYLPPILSVLLSRCKDSSELIPKLIELRAEMKDYRKSMREWLNQLDSAANIRDKLEISSELQSTTESFTKKYSTERHIGIYKELAGAFLDAAEDGSITKLITKPSFTLLKRGFTELAPDIINLRRFTGIVHLMDEAFESTDQRNSLSRVFGTQLDISQKEITEAKKYRKFLETNYSIAVPQPY